MAHNQEAVLPLKRIRVQTRDQGMKAAEAMGRELTLHGDIMVTIEKFKPPATNGKKAQLHILIHELALATDNDPAEVKKLIKERFGPREKVRIGDFEQVRPKSWAKLTRDEASDLVYRVRAFATEHGVTLSDPPDG